MHHSHAYSRINIDTIDNLALKGEEPNAITKKDPNKFCKK
jgi:hypothetical protein